MTRYRTIVADPPWAHESFVSHQGGRRSLGKGGTASKSLPYPSLTVNELAALPVADLADPCGCRLFLWTTSRFLPDAFGISESWGFEYRQLIVWYKHGDGVSPFVAHIAPSHSEYLLVCVAGTPERSGFFPSSVITTPARANSRAHSQKPDVFLDIVEQVSPAPRLEMFSRRARFGWDTWGDEALHGTEAVL